MDDKEFDEKDEKELNKHDEKVEERDVLSTVVWAAILIWAGLTFLAAQRGWLEQFGITESPFFIRSFFELLEFNTWNVVALGAGVIILMEVIVRLLVPSFRRHVGGTLIVAAVFIGIGLGPFFKWQLIWPLVLIAVGISVLIGAFSRKR
ncbi:MAG TPA: hypothetical protein G4N92_06090 [Anaerolineae bacterium]|nr:hypothetical protein [Anaerolineae bacterium]